MSGAFAKLANNKIRLQTADKDVQEDALRFTWEDARSARLTFQDAPAMDLSPFAEKGVIRFDIKANRLEPGKGGLSIALSCGYQCFREVSLNQALWQNSGNNQWLTLNVPIACLIQEGDDFTSVERPFNLHGGGSGEVEVANIRLLREGEGTVACHHRDQLSVTPEMLNEFWSVSWWQARHQEKLALAKKGDVDLLFIGDSITQGWENQGKAVWSKYYGKRKALNLGFSGDRTENVIWRLQHGEVEGLSPKVAVLMIGTNNTGHRLERPLYTAQGVRKIIDTLQAKLPQTKILLLAIFPRSEQPDALHRVHNDKINKLISSYADKENVFFLNINRHMLDKNGVLSTDIMPDLLHPNEKGYAIWAEKMEPTLKRLLAK